MTDPAVEIRVRPVAIMDVEALRALRIGALRLNPVSFTADLAETEARPIEQWREQIARTGPTASDAIFVADAGPTAGLVGMAGVYTPPQPKLSHVGTIWGVYVRQEFRGKGIGEQLVRACIDWARGGCNTFFSRRRAAGFSYFA
jgi:GNAT superfamily N-acetyltransferase